MSLEPDNVDALCHRAALLHVHKKDLWNAERVYRRVLQVLSGQDAQGSLLARECKEVKLVKSPAARAGTHALVKALY